MRTPNERACPASRRSLTGRATAVLLAAGLAACGDAPTESAEGRAGPAGPSMALNAACDTALGGVTHTDSVLAAETWSRTGNPHHVDQLIHVEGAGVLTLDPGVLVCFGGSGGLRAHHGGRLVADGLDTARIVLTATDPANGWWGVHMAGSPAGPSSLKHVRLEHTDLVTALSTHDYHAAHIDSAVFRQNENGLYLWGRGTTIRRSRVDTVTSSVSAAVTLGNIITWEKNEIRGAAGVGLAVLGTNGITLLGGRIEGSGGVGLQVTTTGPGFVDTDPVRVVGGAGYPAELVVSAFPRIYPTLANQDSLLGNARDTLVVTGGILQAFAYPIQALPWRVTGHITVQYYGILRPGAGATLTMGPGVRIIATSGGRVVARGTQAAPVLFRGNGWSGIELDGAPALPSYFTNVRMEHTVGIAVFSLYNHPVVIDSSVFRQTGAAAWLHGAGSRMSRTRVDTAVGGGAAVILGAGGVLESTIIRSSSERGLIVTSATATVRDCEIRDSVAEGIDLWDIGVEVHDCNLVNNGGVGIGSISGYTGNVEDNWWGDAAGPTGPAGDGVGAGLDYTPWLTTPVVLPYVP